jgi:hypothetical protein
MMINTKIYKAVYNFSEKLMAAAKRNDQKAFDRLYDELKALCLEHQNSNKDHPEQWETLADFTEDLSDAVLIYQKALDKATAINSKDHMSSIGYSMAKLQIELNRTGEAIKSLQAAKISANKIEDKELKAEIDELLTSSLIA